MEIPKAEMRLWGEVWVEQERSGGEIEYALQRQPGIRARVDPEAKLATLFVDVDSSPTQETRVRVSVSTKWMGDAEALLGEFVEALEVAERHAGSVRADLKTFAFTARELRLKAEYGAVTDGEPAAFSEAPHGGAGSQLASSGPGKSAKELIVEKPQGK